MRFVQTFFAILCFTIFQPIGALQASDDIELVEYMQLAQYFTHKTNLAIQHRNQPLAKFYAHELEEVIEKIEAVASYDDFPVGKLAKEIIAPAFEKFEHSLEKDAWSDAVPQSFDGVIQACNSCHKATDHGFIAIVKNSENTFMQSFKPQ